MVKGIAQGIKGMLVITGYPFFKDPIEEVLRHHDVGLMDFGFESSCKGLAGRKIEYYVSGLAFKNCVILSKKDSNKIKS